MTTKKLNRKQARWAKFLLEFNFNITYRPGKKSEKPDTLTKLAQNRPKGFDNACQQHQFQTPLKADQLDDNVKKALAVVFCANKVNEIDELDNIDEVDEDGVGSEVEKDKNVVDAKDYIGLELNQHSNLQHNLEQGSSSTKMAGSKIKNSLENLLDKAYQADKVLNSIIAAKQAGLRKLLAKITKQGIKLAIRNLTLKDSRRSTKLYVRDKMYVPNSKNLKLFLLQQHHNLATHGHPEYKAML